MEKEVDPQVLAVINEKRLSGPRLTPVEIVAKMGVFDARDKPYDHAWMATGDNVICTIWAEHVNIGSGGRWFYLESMDTQRRADGAPRAANTAQRAKDRLVLLKRTFDAGTGFRAVLQTNRVAIAELEVSKGAKVSTRVRDETEWHVASWEPEQRLAVLVRGPSGWVPGADEISAAAARVKPPAVAAEADAAPVAAAPAAPLVQASPAEVQAAAVDYVTRHFTGYGYKADNVSAQQVGYDIDVSNAKGAALLKVVVKGTSNTSPTFRLTGEERTASVREPLWRLLVVMDAGGPTQQHKIYKPSEMTSAPGFDPVA